MKDLLNKIDNDTLIVVGLIVLAIMYSFNAAGEQIVNNIVSVFAGYIGGQYVNTKKE
jgi:hypothetical protein